MWQSLNSAQDKYAYLPNAALLFQQLLEPPEPAPQPETEGLSCAELVTLGEQSLFVNDLVASIAAQYIWRLLYRQPLQTFVSFIDGDGLSVHSLPICRDELLPTWKIRQDRFKSLECG